MKLILLKLTLFLILTIHIMTQVVAQETDLQLIEQTVNSYLNGITHNDYEMISHAFDKNATMKFISEGYKEVVALDFFQSYIKPGPQVDQITNVTSVNIAGNAASVQAEMQRSTFTYYDFLNLLKIDGEWKIVGKIYYKKEH